jgi:uncharacterized membrane protein YsdA (DUF1294 family)/cold shock CspA family protein
VRTTGRLVKWDETRGFGFIRAAGGGPEIFVHASKFRDRGRPPHIGADLNFEVARDLQNRLSAADVRYGTGGGDRRPSARRRPTESGVWPAALLAASAIGAVTFAALNGWLPLFLPALLIGASLVAFIAYAFDKAAALNRRWRTAEQTLHLINLLGGWPGGLVASRLFRHKSKKPGFRATFYACIALNCLALGWIAWARPF